jgi:hypothetical protein
LIEDEADLQRYTSKKSEQESTQEIDCSGNLVWVRIQLQILLLLGAYINYLRVFVQLNTNQSRVYY